MRALLAPVPIPQGLVVALSRTLLPPVLVPAAQGGTEVADPVFSLRCSLPSRAGWTRQCGSSCRGQGNVGPPHALGSSPKPLWLGKPWLPRSGVQARSCLLLAVAQEAPGTHPEPIPWGHSMC